MSDGDAERDPGLRERAEVTRAATEEANRLRRLQRRMHSHPVSLVATKFVVAVIGLALVAAGIVMLVAPAPASSRSCSASRSSPPSSAGPSAG